MRQAGCPREEYVRFANDAKNNVPYSATVTADVTTTWYLLLDNRSNGTANNAGSPNSTDPDLGGNLAWVANDWTRVNTGISPNGQADYTGVDEVGTAGVGPGVELQQFYAIYTPNAGPSTSITLSTQGTGSNMYALVAANPIPEPSTFLLAVLGILGAAMMRRRRR